MSYQDDLLALGSEIFRCPHCRDGGACQRELADVSNSPYKHGPEMSFVGESYGQPGLPRILFTRLNPTWDEDIGWFGTRESIEEYRLQNPDADARDIFRCCLKGWSCAGKDFRGMRDAGTVTGHPNQSRLRGEEKRRSPRYGIQLILEEMIRAEVFPAPDDSPLQFCAINNLVKCAGRKRNGKPSASGLPAHSMYASCKSYYNKELHILAPHVLVVFGDKAKTHLKLPSGAKCLYFPFPHPLPPGKWTWRGDDVSHVRPAPDVDRESEPRDEERFKAGPDGSSTSTLFKYTLYLVGEAKRLRDGLNSH